ncbi:serine/threonine-protein kinase [Actinacidiphila alni]|uniref:serine/threonine-protein kinase n=1 Tax=Actinacidiphila alni TaxID=380248 RepID=UPI0033FEE737
MQRLEPGDPRTVGPYRTLARIGTGGMAAVYLARSRGGRAVAVKVMHAHLAREAAPRDRFRREIAANSAAGGVHSPSVLDADPDAAAPWMATEFLPSVSLRDAVERFGALPAGSVRRLAAGLAEALADLHRGGIVHLDVTPANVLLTAAGPRLIDFGIAAGAGPGGPAGAAGSWGFMSPEQVAGAAGPPSDVHSLGATLEFACGADDAGAFGELRALAAECRRPDAAARPTAAELVRRLAPAGAEPAGAVESAADWLPPRVLAAIDASAGAADNPPLPAPLSGPDPEPSPGSVSGALPLGPESVAAAPPLPLGAPEIRPPGAGLGRRRMLFGAAAAVVAVAGGTTAAVLATRPDGEPSAKSGDPKPGDPTGGSSPGTTPRTPTTSPAPAAPAVTTPAAKPAELVFEVTGGGALATVSYGVNGRLTRLRSAQRLPWRRTVEVTSDGSTDWELMLTLSSGSARCRVLLDGSPLYDEHQPKAIGGFPITYPWDVMASGAVAHAAPDPSAGA